MESNNQNTVLVTGGSGFIGSYLVQALTQAGHDVVAFDRNPDLIRITGFKDYETKIKPRLTFIAGDLTSLTTVMEVFDKYRPSAVFHLGALLSAAAEASPHMGYHVDIGGTYNVLEAARIYSGFRNEQIRMMFPSSIAAFGTHLPQAKDGSKPLVANEAVQMPTTMYGVAKVVSERLGEFYARKEWVDFRALRFPSVIGAGRGPGGTTVYSTLMVELPAKGDDYQAYVFGETRLAILYVRDAVSALIGLWKADANRFGSSLVPQGKVETPAEQKERRLANRVFNLQGIRDESSTTVQPPKASAIYEAFQSTSSKQKGKVTFATAPADGSIPGIIQILNGFGFLDDTRAKAEWDWKPAFGLQAAVGDFVSEVQSQPDRLKKLELWG